MRKILIVDDSATMRRMVAASLKNLEDVQFDEAESGLEAIERLALSKVDLIILDLNMPDIHGMEVLQFMHNHGTFRNIPVLVLTTRSDETSRSEALESGASVYLTKPFKPHDLAKEIQRLLDEN